MNAGPRCVLCKQRHYAWEVHPVPSGKTASERQRDSAGSMLRRAVKEGRLQRLPCEVCSNPTTEGHHDDYERPLEVRWLCKRHHEDEHHPTKVTTKVTPSVMGRGFGSGVGRPRQFSSNAERQKAYRERNK